MDQLQRWYEGFEPWEESGTEGEICLKLFPAFLVIRKSYKNYKNVFIKVSLCWFLSALSFSKFKNFKYMVFFAIFQKRTENNIEVC